MAGTKQEELKGCGCLLTLAIIVFAYIAWDKLPGDVSELFTVWSGSRVSLIAKDKYERVGESPQSPIGTHVVRLGSTEKDYENAKKALEIGDTAGYQEILDS